LETAIQMERALDDDKDAPFAAVCHRRLPQTRVTNGSEDSPCVVLAPSERRPGLEVVREEEEEDEVFRIGFPSRRLRRTPSNDS
jgi:hypothetical protein